jgi:hypothetical protein
MFLKVSKTNNRSSTSFTLRSIPKTNIPIFQKVFLSTNFFENTTGYNTPSKIISQQIPILKAIHSTNPNHRKASINSIQSSLNLREIKNRGDFEGATKRYTLLFPGQFLTKFGDDESG